MKRIWKNLKAIWDLPVIVLVLLAELDEQKQTIRVMQEQLEDYETQIDELNEEKADKHETEDMLEDHEAQLEDLEELTDNGGVTPHDFDKMLASSDTFRELQDRIDRMSIRP